MSVKIMSTVTLPLHRYQPLRGAGVTGSESNQSLRSIRKISRHFEIIH